MADICIFYSEPDKGKVKALSSILQGLGWSVWWDKDIKSGRWASEIERNINLARCVIPIWNSHAAKEGSITFTEADKSRELKKPMITLVSEDIKPPIPFNAEQVTADITKWNSHADAACILKIVESVESVLGIAPQKWKNERPNKINLMGKQIKLPCFVKSLSSHETQLDPEAGLTVLSLFPNVDALLVSAYDMYLAKTGKKKKQQESYKRMHKLLKKLDERGTLILLDSGNYEKSRKNDKTWNKKKYESVLKSTPYTYAFCYDNLTPKLDIKENVKDVIARIEGEHEDFLIPVLHAPKDKFGERKHDLLPEIFLEYASIKHSPFIAVPERELGSGICKKAETITKIREKLRDLGRYQPIHILGTGNPLSLLFLAAAGADLFDGLEWCRTVADGYTGFLFHHQHLDLFQDQAIKMSRYPMIKDFLQKDDVSLTLKMALHNLGFFEGWMEELQGRIKTNTTGGMLTERIHFDSRYFIDEFKKLMPGLFK